MPNDTEPLLILKSLVDAAGKATVLAQVIDVSESHLSNMLHGRRTAPTLEQVREWAHLLVEALPSARASVAIAFAAYEWKARLRAMPDLSAVGDPRDEIAEVPGALGRLNDAHREDAPAPEKRAAFEHLVQQVEKAGAAVLGCTLPFPERRRVVGGGR